MRFIKGLLRFLLWLILFPVTLAAISVGVLPATTAFVNFASGLISVLGSFWWLSLAIGGAIGLVVVLILKLLPISSNALRFVTELALLGLTVAGLAYIGVSKIGSGLSVIPANLPINILDYAPWLEPVLLNNTYISLAGGAVLFAVLVLEALIRHFLSLKKPSSSRLERISRLSKEDSASGRNVVSSANVDNFDLTNVKPKKYVKDIWGHYIEEDEYNARINRARNSDL